MDTATSGNLPDSATSADYIYDGFDLWEFNFTNFTNISGSRWRDGDPGEEGEREEGDLWREIPLGIVLTFLCLLTTVGNILVLHAVRTEKRLQSVSNMFIVSLAVADLIVGMTVMPISTFYIFAGHWPFGVAVCQIWIGIDYTASTASILNLFILSLDRYWSVRAPLQYLHKRTRRRALSMISLVWVVSSLWVIPIAGWHYFAHGGVRTVPADVCDTEYAKNSVFKVVTAFFNFYLPLTIMYALYIRVFIEIRKRSVFELGQRNPGRRRLSFHVKANPAHCRSQDDEDSGARDEDTFTEDRLSRDRGNQETSMTSLQRFQHCGGTPNSVGRIRENGARPKQSGYVNSNCNSINSTRNLRLLAMRRQMFIREQLPPSSPTSSLPREMCKVEYVYDENVLDPQTEKLERYYYEERPERRCLQLTRFADRSRTPRHACAASEKGLLVRGCGGGLGEDKFSGCTGSGGGSSSGGGSGGGGGLFATVQNRKPRSIAGSKFRSYGTAPLRSKKKSADGTPALTKFSLSCDILPSPSRDPCVGSKCKAAVDTSAIELSCRTDASSSSSSSSTFDDCRGRRDGGGDDRHPHRYHHTNHSAADDFSLVSGLRRMRLAETLVDQAIVTGGGSGEGGTDSDDCGTESGQGEIFVLRDDKNRRLTGTMLNLRHRIINNFRVSSHSSLKKEIKAARQLGVIMGAFTLCFLPYFILFLVVAFCHDCIEPGLLTAATWVGYLNSTLNPFLYPLCNAAFRRKFRTMLRYRPSSSSSSARYNYYERNSMTRARYD